MKTKKTLQQLVCKSNQSSATLKALREGAAVDAVDELGASALLYAIVLNRHAQYDALFAFGATIPTTFPDGRCVLAHVVRNEFVNMVYKLASEFSPEAIANARLVCQSRRVEYVLDVAEFGKEEADRRWKEDHQSAKQTKQEGSEITQVIRALSQPQN